MPRDLVDVIKELRKPPPRRARPSDYDGASMSELEDALVKLAQWVQRLQDQVDDLRDELKSGRRGAGRR